MNFAILQKVLILSKVHIDYKISYFYPHFGTFHLDIYTVCKLKHISFLTKLLLKKFSFSKIVQVDIEQEMRLYVVHDNMNFVIENLIKVRYDWRMALPF